MKTRIFSSTIIIKLALLMFVNYLNGQALKAIEKQGVNITTEQIDLIEKYCGDFPNNSQVSISLIKNGVAQFYGVKRINDSFSKVNNHQSVFGIGSISKVFTASLLANAVVNDQLNLDDNISTGFDFKLKENINWLQLANHTSGFPRLPSNLNLLTMDIKNPYKDYGEKELNEYLNGNVELLQKPGKKYEYSNLGVGLSAYLLSQKYNSTYEQLLKEQIFSELKMNNSTTNKEIVLNQLVEGRDAFGKLTPNWDFNVLRGAGAILSTVEDLSKFALAHFDNDDKVLALTRKSTSIVNDNMEIGLGWHILKNEDYNNWFWHNGGTGGYTASMTIDPLTKNGIIILSNTSPFHPKTSNIDQLCFELMKTLYKQ